MQAYANRKDTSFSGYIEFKGRLIVNIQNKNWWDPSYWPYLLGACFGAFAFWYIFGLVPLNPSDLSWMTTGDAAQHYLGWSFFRDEPWSWPLGKLTTFNAPEGSSIVYTDSLPLFALFFKMFERFLPEPFQYRGLWAFFCYVMTGIASLKLLLRVGQSWTVSLIGCVFFLMSPVVALRALGHDTLAGQWLIILGLYLYLKPYDTRSKLCWTVLCVVASMVHFYLLAMVLAIWAAYYLKSVKWRFDKSFWAKLAYPFVHFSLLFAVMWICGYFVISGDAAHSSSGYGTYSLNLTALWNPQFTNTLFLDAIPVVGLGQWEGYNYLGAGVICLIGISVIVADFKNGWRFSFPNHLFLIIVLLVLSLFSVSNKVCFGPYILFHIELPNWLTGLASTLRSSGRMFWPVYYSLYLLPFILLRKISRFAIPIALLAIVIQFYDLGPFLRSHRLHSKPVETILKSPLWEELLEGKSNISFVPAQVENDDYLPFAFLAAERGMSFNTGYFARVDVEQRLRKSDSLRRDVANGDLDPNTLYIMRGNLFLKPESEIPFTFGTLDGYPFIAPSVMVDDDSIEPWKFVVDLDKRELGLVDLVGGLGDDEYLFLSVMDDAFSSLSEEWKGFIDAKGGNLGKLAFRGSYALILDRSGILHESLENESSAVIDLSIANKDIRIFSGGSAFGNRSSIVIDGVDLSTHRRGMNVVVWNRYTGRIRRYCFDTCGYSKPRSPAL